MTQFISTRDSTHTVSFGSALQQGLAPDGGLYVPRDWPRAALQTLFTAGAGGRTLPELASAVIQPFAAGEPLADELGAICAEAFNFSAPLVPLLPDARLSVLELFHGPTAAFKDFGARFLAASFARLRQTKSTSTPLKILVATSGDTGGAVAAAFHRRPGVEVVVLYPQGLVSRMQEQQLTCWDQNVLSCAVRGTFDDCQRLVKEAFLDPQLRDRFELSSANSINLGRLLPQAVYYVASSLQVQAASGGPASYIIPSGNLGNATACLWAHALGAPIDRIVLAHNANRTVPDFLEQGVLRPRPSIATLASAMDVGNPSNLERLSALFPDPAALRGAVSAVSVDDNAIRQRIRADYLRTDYLRARNIWCPHTAVAAEAHALLSDAERAAHRWVLVATAHPAKFGEIVEPLIGASVPMPDQLAQLFQRATHKRPIEPTLASLKEAM